MNGELSAAELTAESEAVTLPPGLWPVARLGAGGHGIVLHVVDIEGRSLALKMARRRERSSAAQLACIRGKLTREADTLRAIGAHPGIVRLVSSGTVDDEPFLLLGVVPGVQLDRVRLAPAEAAPMTRQILAALEHIHARGFVHGDVSPRNMVADAATGSAVLVDFSCSRLAVPEDGVRAIEPEAAMWCVHSRVIRSVRVFLDGRWAEHEVRSRAWSDVAQDVADALDVTRNGFTAADVARWMSCGRTQFEIPVLWCAPPGARPTPLPSRRSYRPSCPRPNP